MYKVLSFLFLFFFKCSGITVPLDYEQMPEEAMSPHNIEEQRGDQAKLTTDEIKQRLPWINDHWYAVHHEDGKTIAEHVWKMIFEECNKPIPSRGLHSGGCLHQTGYYIPYDKGQHTMLCTLAEMYQKADEEGLKVADLGCGSGFFSCLIPFISDGVKPLNIVCVDGVQENIEKLKKRYAAMVKWCEWGDNVKFGNMVKMLQELPQTNTFGEKNHGTFDAILFPNVLHLLSVNEKQAQLYYAWMLLRYGGKILFSHMQFNAYGEFMGSMTPGVYQQEVTYTLLNHDVNSEHPRRGPEFLIRKINGKSFLVRYSKNIILRDNERVKPISPQNFLMFLDDDRQVLFHTIPPYLFSLKPGESIKFLTVSEFVTIESLTSKLMQASFAVTGGEMYNFDSSMDVINVGPRNGEQSIIMIAEKTQKDVVDSD